MGIWAEVKKALNSTLGTTGFKSLDTLITESKNAIITSGAIKSIKSVQKGVATTHGNITINSVNPSKCIVLLNGTSIAYNSVGFLPLVAKLTSTALTVYNSETGDTGRRGDTYTYSWQVIEFY